MALPINVSQTPGHGTSYGTNFAGGVGQWKPKKQGVSKKMLGLGVGAVVCTHVFGAFAVRQLSTHVQPAAHMQYQSAPTSLHTPPARASQPCDSTHGSTVGAGVGATVGTGVGTAVTRTHTCASWLS